MRWSGQHSTTCWNIPVYCVSSRSKQPGPRDTTGREGNESGPVLSLDNHAALLMVVGGGGGLDPAEDEEDWSGLDRQRGTGLKD